MARARRVEGTEGVKLRGQGRGRGHGWSAGAAAAMAFAVAVRAEEERVQGRSAARGAAPAALGARAAVRQPAGQTVDAAFAAGLGAFRAGFTAGVGPPLAVFGEPDGPV